MGWQQYLFAFQGRINRAKWWLGLLIQIVSLVIAAAVAAAARYSVGLGALLVAIVIYVFTLWIGLALGAKRLHDRDKSAWFLLIFYGVPLLLGPLAILARANRIEGLSLVCSLVQLAVGIWGLVELGCLRGTPGPNRFGPDPLGRSTPSDAALPHRPADSPDRGF